MRYLARILSLLVMLFPLTTTYGDPIISNNTVSLATSYWPPFVDSGLENGGLTIEIVRAAFKKVGYQVKITYTAWTRAQSITKKGKQDALFPIYYAKKRTTTLVYSDSFMSSPIGFVKRTDRDIRYRELTDLRDYKIGVVHGYAHTKAFDDADYLQKDVAPASLSNFRKLLQNRIDLAVTNKIVFQYLMQLHDPDNVHRLEFITPVLEMKHLYVAFSRKVPHHPRFLQAFNLGLQLLRDSGELDAILAKPSLARLE